MNEQLIDYMKSCYEEIEASCQYEIEDEHKTAPYLYFATQIERLSLHVIEKELNLGPVYNFNVAHSQKLQQDILDLQIPFQEALIRENITTIVDPKLLQCMEGISSERKEKILRKLERIERSKGVLNALLSLRNWAFFPTKKKGAQSLKRLAGLYLNTVLAKLHVFTKNELKDTLVGQFIQFYGKKTRKILDWRIKEKELHSPHLSSIPIYKDEAASYVRYFLHLATIMENSLKQQYVEMAIYLALSLAFVRRHNNYIRPIEILKITKKSISKIPENRKTTYKTNDIREESKGDHEILQLSILKEFLDDKKLWAKSSLTSQKRSILNPYGKLVCIGEKTTVISQRLAYAIKLMDSFSLSYKDVENRLREAYAAIGLTQSSGGISPSCFLCAPHPWKEIDLRYHVQNNKAASQSVI